MSEFGEIIKKRFQELDIRLMPCKFCGEDLIFLWTNKPKAKEPGKYYTVPIDMNLENHAAKCKDNPYNQRKEFTPEFREKMKKPERKKKDEFGLDRW